MVTVTPLPQPPTLDPASVCLTLLSDLTPMMPPDITLDFHVEGMAVSDAAGAGKIAVLVDNGPLTFHGSQRCNIPGLSSGYHLLRAFLVFGEHRLCVKTPCAYVETEFFVLAPKCPESRSFMFGQPSVCILQPRALGPGPVKSIICDLFVNNCEVSGAAHGFSIKVVVNGSVVGLLREWTAFQLNNVEAVDGRIRVGAILVNPVGEDVVFPAYNCEEIVLTAA